MAVKMQIHSDVGHGEKMKLQVSLIF